MSDMKSFIRACGEHYLQKLKEIDSVSAAEGEWDSGTDTFDISFKYDEKLTLLLIIDQDDPSFVRIILPNFYSIDSAHEKRNADDAVSRANQKCKGVKLYLNDDRSDTTAAVEFLDPFVDETYREPGIPKAVLQRYVQMILSAASFYAQKLG